MVLRKCREKNLFNVALPTEHYIGSPIINNYTLATLNKYIIDRANL